MTSEAGEQPTKYFGIVWLVGIALVLVASFGIFFWIDRGVLPNDDAILLMRLFDEWNQGGQLFGWLRHIEGETGNVWPFVVLAVVDIFDTPRYAIFLALGQTLVVAVAIVVVMIARAVYLRLPYALLAGALTIAATGQLSALTWAVPIQHTVSVLVFEILLLALLRVQSERMNSRGWWGWWLTLLFTSSLVWTLREPVVVAVAVLLVVVVVEGFTKADARLRLLSAVPLAGGLALAAIGLMGRAGSQLAGVVSAVCPDNLDCLHFSALPFTLLLPLTATWGLVALLFTLVVIRQVAPRSSESLMLTSLRHENLWRASTMVLILAACMIFAGSALLVSLSLPFPVTDLHLHGRWIVSQAPQIVPISVGSACLLVAWKLQRLIFWLLMSAIWFAGATYLATVSNLLPAWGGLNGETQDHLILLRYSVYVVPLFALAVAGMWWTPEYGRLRDSATVALAIGVLVVGGLALWGNSVKRLGAVDPLVASRIVYTFNPNASTQYVVCPTALTSEFLQSVNADFGPRQGWRPLTAQDILTIEREESPAVKALLERATPIASDQISDQTIADNYCVRVERLVSIQ